MEPRPGGRAAIASGEAQDALGAERREVPPAAGAPPAACLDRACDEMTAQEPEGDATAIVTMFVTA